jgi:hypothetical protein
MNEYNELKYRAKKHSKRQKGLSPFCNFLENPVGGMETFNNSTCMGEDINTNNQEEVRIATNNSGDYLVKAGSGDGYTVFNQSDVRIGHITANDNETASDRFKMKNFDKEDNEPEVEVRESLNIREHLNNIDKKSYNKYDLLNLYESVKHTDALNNRLSNLLKENKSIDSIYKALRNAYSLNESFDFDDEYDFGDGEVSQGASFFSDGYDWKWIRRIGDVEHLDFDNWAVWMAFRPEDENIPEGRNVVNFFVVDEDTGFIDWGPVETEKEAREFLQSKVSDWEDYEFGEQLKKESDPFKKEKLKREINKLEDEILDASEDEYSYRQGSLIKAKNRLEEAPSEDDLGTILYDDDREHIVTKHGL